MKIVLVLGIIIGVLLGVLFYITTRYTAGNVTSTHVKVIEKNPIYLIKTMCYKQIEYIVTNGNGTSVTVAVDENGKPSKCNY